MLTEHQMSCPSAAVTVVVVVVVVVVAEVSAVAVAVVAVSIAAVAVVIIVVIVVARLLEGLTHVPCQLLALLIHLLLYLEQPISNLLQNAVVVCRLASCICRFISMHGIGQIGRVFYNSIRCGFFCRHAVSLILGRVPVFLVKAFCRFEVRYHMFEVLIY